MSGLIDQIEPLKQAAAEALRAVPLLRRGSVRSECRQAHGVRIKGLAGNR